MHTFTALVHALLCFLSLSVSVPVSVCERNAKVVHVFAFAFARLYADLKNMMFGEISPVIGATNMSCLTIFASAYLVLM